MMRQRPIVMRRGPGLVARWRQRQWLAGRPPPWAGRSAVTSRPRHNRQPQQDIQAMQAQMAAMQTQQVQAAMAPAPAAAAPDCCSGSCGARH
jgi:hypothetical protein